ncbi:MAG: quinolinate synthase NadA [Thermodesulfobacteriota bacterium]|nr:quinolinate synthase NadA [Thermodesulfobacteriota bacterium]
MIDTTIRRLQQDRNAIILAHNYQPPEIQDLADFCGDSLELSLKASRTDADVIVFCGVHFMAETASIVCPDKTVLLPRSDAGCAMADMITPEMLTAELDRLGQMPVVTYVNSPAAVKAMSTICCTSANVVKVVNSIEADEMLLAPDRNLAAYAAGFTDKTIHFWDGYCPFHNALGRQEVKEAKAMDPDAVLLIHPECRPEVVALADEVLSTSGMLRYAKTSDHRSFLIATENGILHALKKACPDKTFHPVSPEMICPDMKIISPKDVAACLETMQPEVRVTQAVREGALQAVERMLALA